MECKLNCPYQLFTFLSKYDTVCPFFYNQSKCYNKTKYKMKEIIKYDNIIKISRINNSNVRNNKENG